MDIDIDYPSLPFCVREKLAIHFLDKRQGLSQFKKEIENCKGQYVSESNRIQFKYEKDYVWFLLKWS